jgi:PKD domain
MRITLAVLAGIAALLLPGTAAAIPPTNDNFANATVVGSLPYGDVVNTTDSTTEGGEPQSCIFMNQTVWYSFTPTTTSLVAVDNAGSGFTTNVNVYRSFGSDITSLGFVGCAISGNSVNFQAEAGATYYFQAGFPYGAVGDLQLNVRETPPPANDDFANATPVGPVPYSDSVDATAASIEPNEPVPSCGYGQSSGSVWYAFTASTTGSYSVPSYYTGFWPQTAVYTGSSLSNLTSLGCRTFGSMLTFHADAGQAYYIQLGGLFGARGTIIFDLRVAPDPVANFGLNPGDPSMFDTVGFSDFSYDPAGVGIQSQSWDLGDGAAATGCCPTHRYADGTFRVTLTITTGDGRTASFARDVEVRTHDVAIAKMQVPQSGNVGQTRQITVGLSNKRYGETVQVQLYKSGPSGFELVGTLTQSVPIRSGGRTTDFKFSYTFTSADAALGKVTFKAMAQVSNARDAVPADNEATSLPTKVNG